MPTASIRRVGVGGVEVHRLKPVLLIGVAADIAFEKREPGC